MSTQLFLRSTASDLGGSGQKSLSVLRGSGSSSLITNTAASGTSIQVTDTAGGTALSFFTKELKAVSLSGAITVNIRGLESNASANAGAGIKIERCDSAGSVISTILAEQTIPTTGTEYSTSDAAKTQASLAITSTSLSATDRIKVTLLVKNVGTMGASQTVTNTIDGPTASAAGDTYVTFAESILATDEMTVTATPTGATGCALRVYVLTEAIETGGNTLTQSGSGKGTGSFTPNNSNSLVLWGVYDFFSSASFTAIDGNNVVADNLAGGGTATRFGGGRYTPATTAATPLTWGVTNAEGASAAYAGAVQEILSADGTTQPSIHASSPVTVSSGSGSAAKVTAPFAPPAGATLVAECMAGGSTTAWTISDTSSLTWTKRCDDVATRWYTATVPTPGDTGTGSVRIPKMGIAGTGWAPDLGTGSVRIPKMGIAGSGVPKWIGTGSVRIPKMGLSGSAVETEFGTGSVALPKMGLSGSAKETELGTGSVRIPKLGIAGSGVPKWIGTGSVRIPKLGISGSGVPKWNITGSVRIPKMGLSGSGAVKWIITGSIRIPKMGLSGSGTETGSGIGSISIHKMGLSGTAKETELGTGSVRIPKMGLSGTAKETESGTGSIRIPKMGLSGHSAGHVSGTGSVAISKMGLAGTAKETESGTGSVRIPKMSLSGAGDETFRGPGSVAMHKMHISGSGTLTIRATGSVRMHKMGVRGTNIHQSSNLFIFAPV